MGGFAIVATQSVLSLVSAGDLAASAGGAARSSRGISPNLISAISLGPEFARETKGRNTFERSHPLGAYTEYCKCGDPIKEEDRVNGQYLYYDASGPIDKHNNFNFNGTHLIVAQDAGIRSMNASRLQALQGLDRDLQQSLLNQIRDLWTHTSTALEGNTLTLGETKFVIEEGLTVSGKPLKDHQEVVGHARAIELIYRGLNEAFTEARLFELHKAVQSEFIADIYKPYGDWKVEPNGTYAVTEDGRQTFIEYAAPEDVPVLMSEWLAELNRLAAANLSETAAVDAYAKLHLGFVHIHPFWDGNGRMARLLSNIPVLRAGHLPVVIAVKDRKEYIDALAKYELAVGQLTRTSGVWPADAPMVLFREFCQRAYRSTRQLIEQAKAQQALRDANRRQ